MENSKKKNTDNFYAAKNSILEESDVNDRIIIGKYGMQKQTSLKQYSGQNVSCDNHVFDYSDDDDEYLSSNNQTRRDKSNRGVHEADLFDLEYDDITDNITDDNYHNKYNNNLNECGEYTFDELAYLFKNYKICKLNSMSYYPFRDSATESAYKLFYFDPDNPMIYTCPACMEDFDNKLLYVMANSVVICSNCYKTENTIKYI